MVDVLVEAITGVLLEGRGFLLKRGFIMLPDIALISSNLHV